MSQIKEYSLQEAKEYVQSCGRQRMTFFVNHYGWEVYYTLEPTFATPTGNNKKFKRTTYIGVPNEPV